MKLSIVILAAGNSVRFGSNKLLYQVDGKAMHEHIISKVSMIEHCDKIIVTQYDEIEAYGKKLGFKVIRNKNPELGISSSIILAINQLLPDCDSVCFCVCDQPWLKQESIVAFIDEWSRSKKGLGCVEFQGRLGNPSIFTRQYWPQLLQLKGDIGGKSIIKGNLGDLFRYSMKEPLELEDIDINQEKVGTNT